MQLTLAFVMENDFGARKGNLCIMTSRKGNLSFAGVVFYLKWCNIRGGESGNLVSLHDDEGVTRPQKCWYDFSIYQPFNPLLDDFSNESRGIKSSHAGLLMVYT